MSKTPNKYELLTFFAKHGVCGYYYSKDSDPTCSEPCPIKEECKLPQMMNEGSGCSPEQMTGYVRKVAKEKIREML